MWSVVPITKKRFQIVFSLRNTETGVEYSSNHTRTVTKSLDPNIGRHSASMLV